MHRYTYYYNMWIAYSYSFYRFFVTIVWVFCESFNMSSDMAFDKSWKSVVKRINFMFVRMFYRQNYLSEREWKLKCIKNIL